VSDIAQEIGSLLKQHGLTLGVVESATGGLISQMLTAVTGSSDYYQGSVTSYSNQTKTDVVGVRQETLDQYGAVSPQVAEEMAAGGRKLLDVDVCLSDTGIAGPGGATETKAVGLFYLGLAHHDGVASRKHVFKGDRQQNCRAAAEAALGWLKEYLQGLK
jgi:PncC family amidohydrolase